MKTLLSLLFSSSESLRAHRWRGKGRFQKNKPRQRKQIGEQTEEVKRLKREAWGAANGTQHRGVQELEDPPPLRQCREGLLPTRLTHAEPRVPVPAGRVQGTVGSINGPVCPERPAKIKSEPKKLDIKKTNYLIK